MLTGSFDLLSNSLGEVCFWTESYYSFLSVELGGAAVNQCPSNCRVVTVKGTVGEVVERLIVLIVVEERRLVRGVESGCRIPSLMHHDCVIQVGLG